MGQINTPLPAKLIIGILTSVREILAEAEVLLTEAFGPIDARSDLFLFDFTHYYDAEMGSPIYRSFFSFADLIEAPAIVEAKIKTNEMESLFLSQYPAITRPINLDPGYMEQSKIVLASTKNFFHRILVSKGIYAEVTLHFQDNQWCTFPWTFPDYKSERYHPFFASLRDHYRRQLSDAGFKIRIPKKPKTAPKQKATILQTSLT
jgi:hypothetical protein